MWKKFSRGVACIKKRSINSHEVSTSMEPAPRSRKGTVMGPANPHVSPSRHETPPPGWHVDFYQHWQFAWFCALFFFFVLFFSFILCVYVCFHLFSFYFLFLFFSFFLYSFSFPFFFGFVLYIHEFIQYVLSCLRLCKMMFLRFICISEFPSHCYIEANCVNMT